MNTVNIFINRKVNVTYVADMGNWAFRYNEHGPAEEIENILWTIATFIFQPNIQIVR